MPLRQADVKTTRRFEDGEAWIELRVQLTKGERDRLRDLTASYSIDATGTAQTQDPGMVEINNRVAQANRALFEMLCVDWSLPGEPSGAAYAGLDDESGQWVDDCIEKVLRERRERAEKNAPSPRKPTRRATSSAKADG